MAPTGSVMARSDFVHRCVAGRLRALAAEKMNCHRLRLHDDAINMLLDQIAFGYGWLGVNHAALSEMVPDRCHHCGFNLVRGHAGDAAGIFRPLLQEGMRHVISIPNALLVRMRGRHPLAALVKNPPGEN
jgi:hypothetical protein